MPQLIGMAVIGGVAWLAYRAIRNQMQKVGEELDAARKKTKPVPLKKDNDGVYRPEDE